MCLIAGIYVGDAMAASVPLVLWQWLFVGLLAVVLLLYLLNRHAIVQTLILFGIMVAGGAWRIAYVERQQRYAFSGEEEEAYEAVVVAQPIEKKRSFKCELAIVRGRLAGHRVNAYFQKSHTDTAALSLTVGDGITARSVFSHFDDDARAQRGGFQLAQTAHGARYRCANVHRFRRLEACRGKCSGDDQARQIGFVAAIVAPKAAATIAW